MDTTVVTLLPALTTAAASPSNNSLTLTSTPDPTSSASSASATQPTDAAPTDHDLKRSWLHLLPVEQVVSIVLRLDEYAPLNVRREIWPNDLGAVIEALSGSAKAKGKGGQAEKVVESEDAQRTVETSKEQSQTSGLIDGRGSPTTDVEETPATIGQKEMQVAPALVSTPTADATPSLHPHGLPAGFPASAGPASTSLPVPPLAPAPPGVATGIPTASAGHIPYPYTAYPTYAGRSSVYPFNLPHPLTAAHQNGQSTAKPQGQSSPPVPPPPPLHPFPFGPLGIPFPPPTGVHPPPPPNDGPFTRTPLPPPHVKAAAATTRANLSPFLPHPNSKGPLAEDLPSYEEMIVQALLELGATDPNIAAEGAVPKQLFQWMAQRYPLQQNFRPSASQALQKAYKRGRFEKSKDGRYRLNDQWEGGNTSKRTTRRPQSQAQAGINPHPSSHPPPNGHPYPRYDWYPPPADATGTHPVNVQNPTPETTGNNQAIGSAQDQEHDTESAREALEAAHSILQALNITALLQQAKAHAATEGPDAPNITDGNTDQPMIGDTTALTTASATVPVPSGVLFPPPIFAGNMSLGSAGPSDTGGIAFPSPSTSAATVRTQSLVPQIFANPLLPQEPLPSSTTKAASTTIAATAAQTASLIDPALTSGLPSGRAALQGSLALLAAQLADIAGAEDEEPAPDNQPAPNSSDMTSTVGTVEVLAGLEALLGINWSASLKGLNVQS